MKLLLIIVMSILFTITIAFAGTAFKTGESIQGLYKICYYNCYGSTVAITVKATDICPLSIECDPNPY